VKANKILVPLDGSRPSTLALYYALELANLINDEVVFMHVLRPGKVDSDTKIRALSMLKNAKTKAEEKRLKASVRVAVGDPADEIIKESKNGVRQIVMGSRGASHIDKILMGSVAEKVIKESHIPVTVVK
jgi:nucleotide-binding universal stress UspA family protein